VKQNHLTSRDSLSSGYRIVKYLAVLLVLKVVATVFVSFRDYFPPDFDSEFLLGRSDYFYGTYQWAFYSHIVSGPVSLVLGLLLISDPFRQRFPGLHRRLGRVQIGLVLLLVTPSGLWMARRAATGMIAGIGFGTLAVVTAICVVLGWRRAVQRRFEQHRQWMLRCFVLLCSAVLIRVIGGAAEMLLLDGVYPISAWVSWLVPLILLELQMMTNRPTLRHPQSSA